MKRFIASIFLLLSSAHLEAIWAATPVQFTLVRDYLIVVQVTTYDAVTYPFLLDTGSNTSLVTPEFAQRLGFPIIDRIELVTVAGTRAIPRGRMNSLTLGSKTAHNLEVLVSDLQAVRSVVPNVCGVLGQNFLSQFSYLLDFSNRQMYFEENGEFENRLCGLRLPFETHEGRILVPASNHLRLVLDSAISTLSFFDAATQIKTLTFTGSKLQPMKATTDAGTRTIWQGQLQTFNIGQVTFQNLAVALFETKASGDGRVEDGLLPLRLFDSIYLNQQKKFLILNPNQVLR